MSTAQKYQPITQGQTLFSNLSSRYTKMSQDLTVKEAAVLNLRLERLSLHDETLDALRSFINVGNIVYLKDGKGNFESVVVAPNKLYDDTNCKWLVQVRSKLGSLRMEYVDDLYVKSQVSLSDEEIVLNEAISAIKERIADWPKDRQEAFLNRLDGWNKAPNTFTCGADRANQHTTSKLTGRGFDCTDRLGEEE